VSKDVELVEPDADWPILEEDREDGIVNVCQFGLKGRQLRRKKKEEELQII